MVIMTVRGQKITSDEISTHLLSCKECRKLREDFHVTIEWHKKQLKQYGFCETCNNPEHLHDCTLCKGALKKFHLMLSSHIILETLRKL